MGAVGVSGACLISAMPRGRMSGHGDGQVSPRASESLWEAMERSPHAGEDRLTEVLAHVLSLDDEARDGLCGILNLPSYDDASITTQLPLLSGRRVDLEMQLRDSSGWHVVWIEAKIDAKEQQRQLLEYACELTERYSRHGTLVAVAREGSHILELPRSTA